MRCHPVGIVFARPNMRQYNADEARKPRDYAAEVKQAYDGGPVSVKTARLRGRARRLWRWRTGLLW